MNDQNNETLRRLLKGVLKSDQAVQSCLDANRGKSLEAVLEAAVAIADTRKIVRTQSKKLVESKEVAELRRKVRDQDFEELMVTARALVLCGLPYEKTTERQIVKTARLGNGSELTVTFTAVGKHPLPYGKDRGILALVTTLAARNDNPKVAFRSAMEFLEKLNLDTGGKGYSYLRGAIDRLKSFHCYISGEGVGEDGIPKEVSGNRAVVLDAVLPSRTDANLERNGGVRLFSGNTFWVELDPTFFKELQDHGVPIPLEILRRYTNNPMAFDFITFLNYRIRIARKPSRIPIDTLAQMLGTTDTNHRKVRWRLEKVIAELREIWPECPAHFEGRGTKTMLYVAPPANGKYLVMDKADRQALAMENKGKKQPATHDTLEGEILES